MTTSLVRIPQTLAWLFEMGKWRYKVLYGGRAGMKSHTICRALIVLSAQRPLRIMCARETKDSMKESVHELLSSLIGELGIPGFTVEKQKIYHANGSEFMFEGLRHDVSKVKGAEAVDIVWVEEAQNVSKHSWDTLTPTIRKPGSEIWVSFNPDLEEDETYKRFVSHPRPRSRVERATYLENPWASRETMEEADQCRKENQREYEHIWLGACRSAVTDAIYEGELAQAELQNRITRVDYDPAHPVHTYWDLGWNDTTTCWMIQYIARELRVINYHQSHRKTIEADIKAIQEWGYMWGTDYLPWDGGSTSKQTGKSMQQTMTQMGRKVHVVPQSAVHLGIQAVRLQFPRMWFDSVRCAEGIKALRYYRYGEPASTGLVKREPLHNWASHAADGLRTCGMARTPAAKIDPKAEPANLMTGFQMPQRGGAWS